MRLKEREYDYWKSKNYMNFILPLKKSQIHQLSLNI